MASDDDLKTILVARIAGPQCHLEDLWRPHRTLNVSIGVWDVQ